MSPYDNPNYNPDPHSAFQQAQGLPMEHDPYMSREQYEREHGYGDWQAGPGDMYARDVTAERLSHDQAMRLFEENLHLGIPGPTSGNTYAPGTSQEQLAYDEAMEAFERYLDLGTPTPTRNPYLNRDNRPGRSPEKKTEAAGQRRLTVVEKLYTTGLLRNNRAADVCDMILDIIDVVEEEGTEALNELCDDYHAAMESGHQERRAAGQRDMFWTTYTDEHKTQMREARDEMKAANISADRVRNLQEGKTRLAPKGPIRSEEQQEADAAQQKELLGLTDEHIGFLEDVFDLPNKKASEVLNVLTLFYDDRQFIDIELFYQVLGAADESS